MTDKEIVKALEDEIHLAEYVDSGFCNGVSLSLVKSTLDLINRLQAENERLQETIDEQDIEIARLYKVIERLKIECGLAKFDKYKAEFEEFRTEIETKAYKEIFEKLNNKSIRSKAKVKGCGFLYVSVVTLHDINKLKKELVGEDNEMQN